MQGSPVYLRFSLCLAVILPLFASCGGPSKPPKRGVIESDVDGWGFRRYQSVLDVEVWVAKNKAIAHTASYARKSSEKKGQIGESDVVNVFVTRYEKNEGVRRSLVIFVRRLAQQSGYKVNEKKIAGVRVFSVKGPAEYWVFWAAKSHVIKIGGVGLTKVPEDLVEAYDERYKSRVKAGSLEGPLPEGPAAPKVKEEPFDPDNPKPEYK
jgi:hypothetical protein